MSASLQKFGPSSAARLDVEQSVHGCVVGVAVSCSGVAEVRLGSARYRLLLDLRALKVNRHVVTC